MIQKASKNSAGLAIMYPLRSYYEGLLVKRGDLTNASFQHLVKASPNHGDLLINHRFGDTL